MKAIGRLRVAALLVVVLLGGCAPGGPWEETGRFAAPGRGIVVSYRREGGGATDDFWYELRLLRGGASSDSAASRMIWKSYSVAPDSVVWEGTNQVRVIVISTERSREMAETIRERPPSGVFMKTVFVPNGE
jgi:hypothetical protein